jgi:hypothetical protein
MRQIEKDMLAAIERGAVFKQSNTYAHPVVGGYEVWLYQSLIAKHDGMQWRFNLYMRSLRHRQRDDGRTSASFPGSWEGRSTQSYVAQFERLNHLVPTT